MLGRLKFDLSIIANVMIDNIPEKMFKSATTTFFDPCMGGGQFLLAVVEKLDKYGHSKENIESRIFGMETNQFRINYVRTKYNLNGTFYIGGINESKGINMKFDVILGNPPYQKSLHLKFFKQMYSICKNNLIFVHPSAWLVKEVPSDLEKKCRDIVSNHQTGYTFIKGKHYFGVTQFTPCTITHVHMNKKQKKDISIYDETQDRTLIFKSVKDINYISDSPKYFKLKESIIEQSQHNVSEYIGRLGKYYVILAKVRGSCGGHEKEKEGLLNKDFYTAISKDSSPTSIKPPNNKPFIGFGSIKEANNSINYIKSDFARFCLALLKFDNGMSKSKYKNIPWLDFNKTYTNSKLYTQFNISDNDVSTIINKTIPKYYD